LAIIRQVLKEGLAGWVVREHQIGLVKDTSSDDRWLELPDQPYQAGSALCLPIISAEMLLGVLTLTHSAPGYFSSETTETMRIMVNQLALIIENARLFGNLRDSLRALGTTQQNCDIVTRSLTEEMDKCRKMQLDFLPSELPRIANWEVEGFFFPANRVSGDFYDVFELPGGYVGLVIGDVCDKGVGAALFMALFRSLIRIFSGEAQLSRSPIHRSRKTVGGRYDNAAQRLSGQVDAIRAVALANDYIAREHGDMSMFATLFFGVLNPKSGRLIYINGGHEPLLIINAGGIKDALRPTGPAVGVFLHAEFSYKERYLEHGDMLFGYTDGVVDARSTKGVRFGKKQLMAMLERPADSVLDLMGRVGTELFAHMGKAPQEDDITMLAAYRKPP
jgi:sigma-B regulation protein RsbU (phosphoserine phosphatase)